MSARYPSAETPPQSPAGCVRLWTGRRRLALPMYYPMAEEGRRIPHPRPPNQPTAHMHFKEPAGACVGRRAPDPRPYVLPVRPAEGRTRGGAISRILCIPSAESPIPRNAPWRPDYQARRIVFPTSTLDTRLLRPSPQRLRKVISPHRDTGANRAPRSSSSIVAGSASTATCRVAKWPEFSTPRCRRA